MSQGATWRCYSQPDAASWETVGVTLTPPPRRRAKPGCFCACCDPRLCARGWGVGGGGGSICGGTHVIVIREEIVFGDVGAECGVAHQVHEAQTQALESRYDAGKEAKEGSWGAPHPPTVDGRNCFGAWLSLGRGSSLPPPPKSMLNSKVKHYLNV